MGYNCGIEQHLKNYPRLTLPGHSSHIHSIRWSPDGTRLASGGEDTTLHLHRVSGGDLVPEQAHIGGGHSADIDQLCWNPENSNQVATASVDKTIKIWDARKSEAMATIKLKSENMTLCWSNNGKTIAVADRADFVTFIDTRNGSKVLKEHKFQLEVNEITWNKENDLLFVTTGDGNVHVLSYPELQTLLVIDASASPCLCIRFDPTGKYFALGSNDAVASIWDSEHLACIRVIDQLEWPIKTLSFSHDSRYLACGSEDSFIDISDIHTGQQEAAIEVGTAPTVTLDFHPKEYILAYALSEKEHRDIGTIKVVGFPEDRRRTYN